MSIGRLGARRGLALDRPNKPFSRKVLFRVAPEVRAQAVLAADLSGKSLNQSAEESLRERAARDLQSLRAA